MAEGGVGRECGLKYNHDKLTETSMAFKAVLKSHACLTNRS